MKDSFDFYKENHQYIKAFNFSDKKTKLYLKKGNYTKYINQVIKSADLLSDEIKDNKRAYKLVLNTLNTTNKKASDYDMVKLLNTLTYINIDLQKYPEAIKIATKSLKLANKSKNDTITARLYRGILIGYLKTEKTDSIYRYLEPNLKSAHKIKDNKFIADAYNSNYAFYNLIKEYDIAKKYLDSSLIFAKKANSKKAIITAKSNLGVHYLVTEKNYKKAIEIYDEIINDTKNDSANTKYDYAIACVNMAFCYENLGDYRKAYNYQTQYVNYTDSLLLHKNDTELEQIRTQYELDKAESKYEEEKLLLKQKQLKSEKMLYLLLTVLMLLAILFYFFYQNLKLKQKNKFKDLNHSIQQNLVNATIDGQEEERKRLSGVLHDNISALLSSASLHLTAFEANHPEIDDQLKKTKAIIKEAHDKVRDLSHALVPPVLEKLGLIPALEDLCEKNSNSLIDFQFNNLIEKEIRFQNDFEMKMYFIVAELFNNIMKHSNASAAFLTIKKENNQLSINIEDNGKGFNTKEGKSTEGYGLSQIKTRIKSLKGMITIDSKEKSGVVILIKIPVPNQKSDAGSHFHNV